MKRFGWVLFVVAVVLLAVSYFISSRNIGISDEELTDYSTAVMMSHDELQTPGLMFFGKMVPIVNSPYQGSLKSWLVAPILRIFGTSVYVNRFLNTVLALIYLLAMYWVLKLLVGESWAPLVFLIPLLDTKFLLYAPFDYGPFLGQLIFISLSIGGILRYIKYKKIKWWYFSNLMIGAILAQKLTSFPAFLSLFLINNTLYIWRKRQSLISLRTFGEILISICCFSIFLWPSIYYFLTYGFTDFLVNSASSEVITFWSYWPKIWVVLVSFFKGFDGVFWVKGCTIIKDIKPVLVFFPIFSVLLVFWEIVKCFSKKNVYFLFSLFSFLFTVLIFTFVRGLTRSHHFFILQPFWMLTVFVSLVDFIKCYKNFWQRWLVLLVVVFGMLANDMVMLRYFGRYKGAVLSSVAIYDLNDRLLSLNAQKVYALNFSLSAPIYYLSGGKVKTVNLAWNGLNSDELSQLLDEVRNNNDTYLVARRSNNYYWSQEWIDWLNRDLVLADLIDHPEKYGVKISTMMDSRGTSFYLIK